MAGRKLIIALLMVLSALVILSMGMMVVNNGVKNGKYADPVVATSVTHGYVLDKNGKYLAVTLSGQRIYPQNQKAIEIIEKAETLFSDVLFPHPGFNEITTKGKNVVLTIDSDIQYILDNEANLPSAQQGDTVRSFIAEADTGKIVATTGDCIVPSVTFRAKQLNLHIVETAGDCSEEEIKEREKQFYTKNPAVNSLIESEGLYNIKNKYILFLATDNRNHDGINAAVQAIETGLRAQSKI